MRKEDFEISKLSYTNKDFASIYPEILDIAKQLTNKWDPSMSNESDPGVVLLKEGAFISDHINYNVDKNILENFLPSATQDRSVRDIVEMNGYTPRYYVSAMGEVRIRYRNDEDTTDATIGPGVVIPKFTIVLSTDDESISYTQVTDLSLTGDSNTDLVGSAIFIQGTLQSLSINNSGIVTLDNLDDNRRLYLPESMVAQNGIFISSVDGDRQEWKRDNYILTRPSGSRIYKVDYDSYMGLPYIEFPTDIATLIGNGLNIRYISTLGEAGNVTANSLVKIISPTEYVDNNTKSWLTEYMTSANASSFTNGKDPETINQMYNSFMKTVGTFETLVTCLDYSNYIYNIEDEMNHNLVSNVYVTDRRTDYNKSLNIVTYDLDGTYFKNVSLKNAKLNFIGSSTSLPTTASVGDIFFKIDGYDSANNPRGNLYTYDITGWRTCNTINLNDFTNLTAAMTPYDLSIYALKLFSIADYNPYMPHKALENSFKPVSDDTLEEIKSYVEESKNICHIYKDPEGNEIFVFKNYAPLKVNIIPYNKVTKAERNEILNNIFIALSENFNPRNIEFGEELDRDQLKKTIIEADDRIKDISLDFDYYMKAMTADSMEYNLDAISVVGDSTILVDLIAKNVLAGRVCLFDFDTRFTFEYGHSDGIILNNITNIKSELKISLADTTSTPVLENATVELSSTTFNNEQSAPNTYRYILNAHSIPTGTYNAGVTLKYNSSEGIYDTFTLQQLDKETGKVIKTYKYMANGSMTYIVDPEGGSIENTTTQDYLALPNCQLHVTALELKDSTHSGPENLDYTLRENEAIQIIYPNFYSTKTYGTYVAYRYTGTDVIYADTEHTLTNEIRFVYTKDGAQYNDIFPAGSTVRANFTIVNTDSINTDITWKGGEKYSVLGSNQTISKRERMTTVVDNTNLLCYWIIKSSSFGNMLFDPGENERILGDQDYFIYADESLNDIIILGSGTKIVKDSDDERDWLLGESSITIDSISEEGIKSNIPWKRMDFNKYNLYITEMTITTLGEGDRIHIYGWDFDRDGILADSRFISNNWKYCTATIDLSLSGKTTTLAKIPGYYLIRSRLDISMSADKPQVLRYSENAIQTLIFGTSTGSTILRGNTNFNSNDNHTSRLVQSSVPISAIGGDLIDLSLYKATNTDINIYSYNVVNNYAPYRYHDNTKTRDINNVISVDEKLLEDHVYPFWFFNTTGATYPNTNEAWIIPIYVENPELKLSVGVMTTDNRTNILQNRYSIRIEDFNGADLPTEKDFWPSSRFDDSGGSWHWNPEWKVLQGSKKYYLLLKNAFNASMNPVPITNRELFLIVWIREQVSDINPACVVIDKPVVVNGFNNNLSTTLDSKFTNVSLLDRIRSLVANSDNPDLKVNYLYEPDSSMAIDLERYKYVNALTGEYDMLAFDNPLILFDHNNVAHDMTIAEVDIANSVIDVARDMRSYN